MEYKKFIDKLGLIPHPEGGYYRETYRSEGLIPKDVLPESFKSDRNYSTLIYYMLIEDDISYLHRLSSDEMWHFYAGSSILIYIIDENGNLTNLVLGNNIENSELFNVVIKAGSWFGAEFMDKSSFSLVGCTVSPGFHFDDFEIGNRDELLTAYPQHKNIILKLSK